MTHPKADGLDALKDHRQAEPNTLEAEYRDGWNDCIDHLAQRGLLQGVPEALVLVPREPTEKMCRAAIDRPDCPGDAFMYEGIYRAMLSAAPKPDDGGEG